jgi:TetR/AcrR family tetracycline transcriptional repressor
MVSPADQAADRATVRGRRGRPPGATLGQNDVVEAAARLAAEGLDHLSMGALAAELGVTPMAVYRHVRDKEHLLALLLDTALRGVRVPGPNDGSWEDRLRALHRRVTRALQRYPGLLFDVSAESDTGARLLEAYVKILLDAGFDERTSAQAYTGLYYLAIGTVTNAHRRTTASPILDPPGGMPDRSATARVHRSSRGLSARSLEAFALETYIAGLRALLRTSNSS